MGLGSCGNRRGLDGSALGEGGEANAVAFSRMASSKAAACISSAGVFGESVDVTVSHVACGRSVGLSSDFPGVIEIVEYGGGGSVRPCSVPRAEVMSNSESCSCNDPNVEARVGGGASCSSDDGRCFRSFIVSTA